MAEVETLIGLGPDTFAVDLARADGRTATVWRLPTA
jgi:hypothetical protein